MEPRFLENLIQEGTVHPKLTLRQAKQLVADFTGKQSSAAMRKGNVRERLRRFAEFVRRTVDEWEPDERKLATETLAQLIEQIEVAETAVLNRDRNPSAFSIQPGPLTDQRIHL